MRQRILSLANQEAGGEKSPGTFECDESYFGARGIRGKRRLGAAGKTPVFGLLKREGKVFIQIVENCSKSQLLPVIQGKVLEGSTINTDRKKAYDSLVINGYDHYRVYHSYYEFAVGKCHINGMKTFWSYAKRRMAKFNGLTDAKFTLHLKETQWRFNHRHDNVCKILLTEFRKNPF